MRSIVDFVKTTLVGGMLFLVPLVVVLYVVREAFQVARQVLAPLAHLSPIQSVGGIALTTLLAVLLLVVSCFVVGLAARTRKAKGVQAWLEDHLLRHIPGYTILRSVTHSLAKDDTSDGMQVALARFEDTWQLAFVFDRLENGLLTVFVPQAPNPFSGTVFYMPADRVKLLDVPASVALRCIRGLGAGSRELWKGRG